MKEKDIAKEKDGEYKAWAKEHNKKVNPAMLPNGGKTR